MPALNHERPVERTLSIIKPDAVASGNIGKIIAMIEQHGFKILAMKMVRLSKGQAENFYIVHKDRPFYRSLTDFMSSGPAVAMLLEGENAIARLRELMGTTDPSRAAEGTIRKAFGTNVERNAIHGSDSPQSADFEIAFFFNQLEVC